MLLHLFRTHEHGQRDVRIMARVLQLDKGFLEQLAEVEFAENTGFNALGGVYPAITPEGRKYLVERKLVGSQSKNLPVTDNGPCRTD